MVKFTVFKIDTPNIQIHDRSLSWLGTDTSLKILDFIVLYSEYGKFHHKRIKINLLYKTMKSRIFKEVSVPSQESERSCICMLGVSILPLSMILIFDFGMWRTAGHATRTTSWNAKPLWF
jgi:hypothetical protein